jgi:hypothetical protein
MQLCFLFLQSKERSCSLAVDSASQSLGAHSLIVKLWIDIAVTEFVVTSRPFETSASEQQYSSRATVRPNRLHGL